jgi:hypothetical protein
VLLTLLEFDSKFKSTAVELKIYDGEIAASSTKTAGKTG